MEIVELKILTLGIFSVLSGIGLLVCVWQDRIQLKELFVAGGVVSLAVSGACWMRLFDRVPDSFHSFVVLVLLVALVVFLSGANRRLPG